MSAWVLVCTGYDGTVSVVGSLGGGAFMKEHVATETAETQRMNMEYEDVAVHIVERTI